MADKALLLGINEYLNVSHLRGCVRDVENMGRLLVDVFGFAAGNVKTLTDKLVVKAEVEKQMEWLFQDVEGGDRVVLHFSGHGSYVDDKDGDEDDGRDELLCLYDMDFENPESYLLDDELRAWTQSKPDGVRLTVVLDNCNSGTGTRMILPAASGKGKAREAVVDIKTALRRSIARPSAARGLVGGGAGPDASAVVAAVADPDSEDFVRVRFIEPPSRIKEKVEELRSKKKRTRGFVKVKELNHVLLSACRADETAADATIDGSPTGAFTHFLCETLRGGGAELERRELIDRVTAALRAGSFVQDPQLEGVDETGPLFGPVSEPAKPRAEATASSGPPTATVGGVEPFMKLAASLVGLAPDVQHRILDLYQQSLAGSPRPLPQTIPVPRSTATRAIVYVHGICTHVAGFSDSWWDAFHPFTTEFGAGDRNQGGSRDEVIWSDLVNARSLSAARGVEGDERARLAAEIRETVQDRMDRHAIESGPRSVIGAAPRALADPRALISIPGLNCIDDFTVYMTNDSVRASIISRFTSVVGPLLSSGVEIDVISHSWGTVVAYEGLRELASGGAAAPLVRNFFTAGSALSIGAVKLRLRPANRDGARPAMVRRWVNLAAVGDLIGGPLQGRPYAVDDDFPSLTPFSCLSFWGHVSPVCAHLSYFKKGNDAVNHDIFAAYINQT